MNFNCLKFLPLFLGFVFSTNLFARPLVIGCATKCDFFFHYALRKVSNRLNLPIQIVDVSSPDAAKDLDAYDGIIFPGGADINPEYYLSSVTPELQAHTKSLDHLVKYSKEGSRRDPIEYKMLQEYFANPKLKNLPVLGVCRGMQMLAVSQGIPLFVDIKTELGIRNRKFVYDRVYMEPGESVMNSLFAYTFKAFKRHHQGIRVPYFAANKSKWPHLKITSYSHNGKIAESLEFSNRPVLGVQFHPENDFGFERNKILGWLLLIAKERSLRH